MNWENKSKEELSDELTLLQKKAEEYDRIKNFYGNKKIELDKINRALRTLSASNHALVRADNELDFTKEVCNIITTKGGYRFAWIGYKLDDDEKSIKPVAQSGFEEGYLERIRITWNDTELGRGPVGTSIRTHSTQITADTLTDPNFAPWSEEASRRQFLSIISFPLCYNEKCYGALAIYSSEKNNFDSNEIGLLEELAGDLAYGITALRNEIERKEFEKELRESEENYRKLVDISPNAIAVHKDGKFVFVNNAGLKIIGAQKSEDIIGTSVINIVHPDYRQAIIERITQMKSGKNVPAMEEKFLRLDGSVIDVMVAASKIIYKGEDAIQVVLSDITHLKQVERKLRESEERFRTIFENASIGIYRTSLNGDILMANPAFYKMLGYSPGENSPKNVKEVYAEPHKRELFLKEIKLKKKVIGYDQLLIKKDGSLINIRNNAKYIMEPDGKGHFIEGTIEDVTAQTKIKEELITAKENAEEMNKIKSSFLANMSHELRTPLVAILGFAEIFQSEFENPIHKEMAESIYASGQRLLETLNSILDLSRIEGHKIDLQLEKVNVGNIIKESINFFANFVQKKGLYIKTNIKNKNAIGMLDAQMVHKIINNLINNAIKYTSDGGIFIEADVVEKDDKDWIKINVKDTGIGIPTNSLKLIFEEFRQVSEGLNRNFEGTGLGLTVTKKFVELLNGMITVSSQEGVGTEFIILLPALKEEKKKEIKNKVLPGKISLIDSNPGNLLPSVLLVENDLLTIDVTKIILRKLFSVEVESTGKDALEAAKNKNYEAVLMDINLGAGMDGTTAMKKMRELPEYEDKPIIAFTAYAMTGDREKFLREGFSDYIAKPFEKKTLVELMNKVFKKV